MGVGRRATRWRWSTGQEARRVLGGWGGREGCRG